MKLTTEYLETLADRPFEPLAPLPPTAPRPTRRIRHPRRPDYVEQHDRQDGLCAACGRPEPVAGRRLADDHDHETGATRERLCSPCNLAIGMLDDDPARADALAAYLRRHGR